MPDTASHGEPQPAIDNARHTMTLRDVAAELARHGVHRSHRTLIRLCQSGAFDAVKMPGPSGDEWYVAPISVPKVIGDLRSADLLQARRGEPQPAMADRGIPDEASNSNTDTASHGEPQPATTNSENLDEPPPGSATGRHDVSDLDIYSHPYVKQLEARAERFERKYDDLVLRNEESAAQRQQQMIELQRMITVGQSETLANFMLKAKELISPPADAEGEARPLDNAS